MILVGRSVQPLSTCLLAIISGLAEDVLCPKPICVGQKSDIDIPHHAAQSELGTAVIRNGERIPDLLGRGIVAHIEGGNAIVVARHSRASSGCGIRAGCEQKRAESETAQTPGDAARSRIASECPLERDI